MAPDRSTPDKQGLMCAIHAFGEMPGVSMDPACLAEGVAALAIAFPRERSFIGAMHQTLRSLKLICEHKAMPSRFTRDLEAWLCLHYHSSASHRGRADMRLIYKMEGEQVIVMGFGHRFLPTDIYARMNQG